MAAKAAAAVPQRGRKLALGFGLVNVPVAFKPLAEKDASDVGRDP